jgi:ABC-type oligopeptide transport system ATPase subunit
MIEYHSSYEIFNHPKDIYTQSLIACRPSTTERVKYLKTVEEIISKEEKYTQESNSISIESFNERIATLQQNAPIFEINNLIANGPNLTSSSLATNSANQIYDYLSSTWYESQWSKSQ